MTRDHSSGLAKTNPAKRNLGGSNKQFYRIHC